MQVLLTQNFPFAKMHKEKSFATNMQGSCDNTPATPDSLDSLVISDESCQSPPSVASELPPPPPTDQGKANRRFLKKLAT
jgi:hypothetical protein